MDTTKPPRPSKADLLAAVGRQLPDVIRPDLSILFCGINPGLTSAAVGHHFARPGNRFWPALYRGGLTDRLLSPMEDHDLLAFGYGLTNLVARATAAAAELFPEELTAGMSALEGKIQANKPHWLAFLGIGIYRRAFGRPKAMLGRQREQWSGANIWVLPNPSGLNAHHQPAQLATLFGELREATAVLPGSEPAA